MQWLLRMATYIIKINLKYKKNTPLWGLLLYVVEFQVFFIETSVSNV